jgi:hypothetical protein
MKNNKQQTAVDLAFEKLANQGLLVTKDYKNLVAYREAKEMEKVQMIDAINNVSENNVKYANMIVSSWSQIEGELFMHNTKVAEQYYNETYRGNK